MSAEFEIATRLRAAGCVFAEDEARVLAASAETDAELAGMVERRVAGLPLEQVVGWAEFCGLRVAVEPGVFVPRPRTELLAEQAIELGRRIWAAASNRSTRLVLVDLCCGSGAIGAVLADALAPVELHAADLDPAAVRCARRNLDGLGQVYEGDLFGPLPGSLRGRVDILVANLPYVPTDAIASLPREAREHEPRIALDGGQDGLEVLRRIGVDAAEWLAPGGALLVETSDRQAPRALDVIAGSGLVASLRHCDERDATVAIGSLPAAP